jgi:hypothetical protein
MNERYLLPRPVQDKSQPADRFQRSVSGSLARHVGKHVQESNLHSCIRSTKPCQLGQRAINNQKIMKSAIEWSLLDETDKLAVRSPCAIPGYFWPKSSRDSE